MGRPLTARQQQVYDFIHEKIVLRGYGPTVREIGEFLGIKSPNGVMCHLRALERKGMIHRLANKSRAIELTNRKPREKQTSLTVLGEVGQDDCRLFDAPKSCDVMGMLEHPERFLLQYNGVALREWAIMSGDILVVQHASIGCGDRLELVRNDQGVIQLQPPQALAGETHLVAGLQIDSGAVICGAGPGSASLAIVRRDMPRDAVRTKQVIGVVVGIVRTHAAAQPAEEPRHHFASARVV